LPVGPAPEAGGCVDRSELHADACRVEVVDHGLAEVGDGGVAEVVSGVEAVGIPGLGDEPLGPGGIVRVAGRLPVELEAAGNDAPGDPGKSERVRLVHRL